MSNYFQPFLVNPTVEDPCLYVNIAEEKNAIMIDCGNVHRLSARLLQKISMLFISHTHVDHFIGFDNLVRTNVHLPRTIRIYGPPGITNQVHYKMLGYTWNILLTDDMEFRIFEICGDHMIQTLLSYRNAFEKPYPLSVHEIHDNVIYEDSEMFVTYAALEHRIPCFGYALTTHKGWSVDKEKLDRFGERPGRWIQDLKNLLSANTPGEQMLTVGDRQFSLAELQEKLLVEVSPQKIAYVTDTLGTPGTETAIVNLAKDADIFFCEAHFTDADISHAKDTFHLTARQAGQMARQARAKQVVGFHHSPRYCQGNKPNVLETELQKAFLGEGEDV